MELTKTQILYNEIEIIDNRMIQLQKELGRLILEKAGKQNEIALEKYYNNIK